MDSLPTSADLVTEGYANALLVPEITFIHYHQYGLGALDYTPFLPLIYPETRFHVATKPIRDALGKAHQQMMDHQILTDEDSVYSVNPFREAADG